MDELNTFPLAPILVAILPLVILTPFLLKYTVKKFLDGVDSKPSMETVKVYVKEEMDKRFEKERVLHKDATIALLRAYFPRPKRRET